ncbi:MAG TPA: hypothetical protein QGH10_00960, partial [Armatimonadota bacterium]|nr:hypothetical protein [Armatimonadota bacterium]
MLAECSIPLGPGSAQIKPRKRPPSTGARRGGSVVSGAPGLRDAVDSFTRRHLRRLRGHLSSPDADCAATFMGIGETIARVLAWYWRRAVRDICEREALSAEEWRLFREDANFTLRRYAELPPLLARHSRWSRATDVLVEAHQQLLGDVRDARRRARATWMVAAATDRLVPATFFRGDCLSTDEWPALEARMEREMSAARDGPES